MTHCKPVGEATQVLLLHKEKTMLATQDFVEQLRQARDATHSKNHPYFRKWAHGELTRKQLGYYTVMHYHFVTQYLNWLAYIWAHCPVDEVRVQILENLMEEEDPKDRHMNMIVDFCEACGYTPTEVKNAPVLPWTEALTDWGWRLVYQQPWEVALTGLTIGLESQPPDIYRLIVGSLSMHYGWNTHDKAIRFFAGHIEADTVHSARGFHIAEVYCNTPQLQNAAIAAVAAASQKRWRHMNGIYWYTLYGRTDDTPTDKT
jgi:pyrroloquinoline-quinone synthase